MPVKPTKIKGVRDITSNIITSPTGRKIVQGSKAIYLPGFSGLSLYDVVPAFFDQLRKTSIRERASGISFNIVMAIPPTLIFIFTLLPYFPISEAFVNQLFRLIRDIVPGEKNNAVIMEFLTDFLHRQRTGLLSFGLIIAIFFSSNAIMGILRTFDKNYPGFLRRKGWKRRKVALKLTMICYFLLFLCVFILAAQVSVLEWLGVKSEMVRFVLKNFRWLLLFLLTFFIISFIYKHGPAVTEKWPLLTPGSVLATTLMIVATALFTFWINTFGGYNRVYGPISIIFVLMSLIYINSFACLMGFELNVTLTELRAKQDDAAAATQQLPLPHKTG